MPEMALDIKLSLL